MSIANFPPEPPPRRLAPNVIRLRPADVRHPPPALSRVTRLLAWSAELMREGLLDDVHLIAALHVLEAALLDHVEARP